MKHLHLTFILASIGLGFGVVLLFGAGWSVHALSMAGWTTIRTYLTAVGMAAAGLVLMAHGVVGVRQEFHRQH